MPHSQVFTREELARGISVKSGERVLIIVAGPPSQVETPEVTETLTLPGALFAFDSAFPTPAALETLRELVSGIAPGRRLGVFGHADQVGSDQYNKSLSDRRARVILAVLTGDVAEFEAVAIGDGWDEQVYQAILRGLGCNPGPVDGKPGAMTKQALGAFLHEYNAGVFHVERGTPGLQFVAESGVLTLEARRALLDAYVCYHSGGLDRGLFVGPKFSGCSEFNPVTNAAQDNRRVTLALYGDHGPAPEDFPCVAGDASKCAIDGGGTRGCKFYRTHIGEPEEEPVLQARLFDFEWLQRPDGAIQLSALSTIPDGEDAEFAVFQTTTEPTFPAPNSNVDGDTPVVLGEQVGDTPSGDVRLGVCEARFEPPEDFDPFDFTSWLVELGSVALNDENDNDDDNAYPETIDSDDFFHPPLFRIAVDGAWGYSLPPGERVARFEVERTDAGPAPSTGFVLGSDGAVHQVAVVGSRFQAERGLMGIQLGVLHERVIPEESDV